MFYVRKLKKRWMTHLPFIIELSRAISVKLKQLVFGSSYQHNQDNLEPRWSIMPSNSEVMSDSQRIWSCYSLMLWDIMTKKNLFNATLCAHNTRTEVHVHRGVFWGWIGIVFEEHHLCAICFKISNHTNIAVPLETFSYTEKNLPWLKARNKTYIWWICIDNGLFLQIFGSFWKWRVALYAPDLH